MNKVEKAIYFCCVFILVVFVAKSVFNMKSTIEELRSDEDYKQEVIERLEYIEKLVTVCYYDHYGAGDSLIVKGKK